MGRFDASWRLLDSFWAQTGPQNNPPKLPKKRSQAGPNWGFGFALVFGSLVTFPPAPSASKSVTLFREVPKARLARVV